MAQEREKTRIVLASILKPVDDTRMTCKMGVTLATAGYAVFIIGYQPAGPLPGNMICESLGAFQRLGLQRYLARWRAFRMAWSVRPRVFIFSTYELIVPAVLLKVFLNARIIYDVRENYYRNILYSEGLPFLLRWPLALVVRGIEKVAAPMIDHFILAEKGYEREFRFHRGGWTVIENKALPIAAGNRSGWNLLFSGTLSASTGVFRAIRLAEKLRMIQPEITLTIVGYAASRELQKKIRDETKEKPYIRLIGIERLVPHNEIVSQVTRSRAGILAYKRLPHTVNTTPTKLYEYLSARLPVICEAGWPWEARFSRNRAFVHVDFENPNGADILASLEDTATFYPSPVGEAAWESEAPRLLEVIGNMV